MFFARPPPGGHGFAARFLKAEDSTQTSGLEKNARHGPTASADPGEPSGLFYCIIELLIMAINSNYYKRRQPGRKAEDFRIAWKREAPESVFSGKTLEDLEASIAALAQASEQIDELNSARSAAVKSRDEKEVALNGLLILVTHGVRSDPAYGEDSALYRSMGFIPKSERGSGLTRRSTGTNKEAVA